MMSSTRYARLTGTVFLVIALLHLVRLVRGWEAAIGGWTVPMWLSVVALIVAGALAGAGLRMKA